MRFNPYHKTFGQPGFLYVLSNTAFNENTYKIGSTTRSPYSRCRELNKQASTAVPGSYEVAFSIKTSNCGKLEKVVHKRLRKYHVGKFGQEFFNAPIQDIISIINHENSNIEKNKSTNNHQESIPPIDLHKDSSQPISIAEDDKLLFLEQKNPNGTYGCLSVILIFIFLLSLYLISKISAKPINQHAHSINQSNTNTQSKSQELNLNIQKTCVPKSLSQPLSEILSTDPDLTEIEIVNSTFKPVLIVFYSLDHPNEILSHYYLPVARTQIFYSVSKPLSIALITYPVFCNDFSIYNLKSGGYYKINGTFTPLNTDSGLTKLSVVNKNRKIHDVPIIEVQHNYK